MADFGIESYNDPPLQVSLSPTYVTSPPPPPRGCSYHFTLQPAFEGEKHGYTAVTIT